MTPAIFQQLEAILAPERLDAYRQDGAVPATTLARYLLNMALCETLYSPLQFAEVALRNALHTCLSARLGTASWYDVIPPLPAWQQKQLGEARQKLQTRGKPITPGRMVAELQFGFWTGFFNNWSFRVSRGVAAGVGGILVGFAHIGANPSKNPWPQAPGPRAVVRTRKLQFNKSHGRTGLGHALASQTFPHAPRSERNMKKLDARWTRIRDLRNRVFHHERIIHWTDLDDQHAAILEIVGWMNPPLHDVARVLDRYVSVRQAGLPPWLGRLQGHWPHPSASTTPTAAKPAVAIVPAPFDASSGAETPFGHRWGGDIFRLSTEYIAALQVGQTLALDVQSEYIAFLKAAESAKLEQAIKANLRGLGYGG